VESRKPHSDYAISKYGAEIWRGGQEGLDVIIVNPGIIIGPGFQEQGSGQLLRRLLTDYITPGKGAFVAVSDVVRMSVELMKSSTQTDALS
jgi:nucleoside-diphosphate-sugar epimerase